MTGGPTSNGGRVIREMRWALATSSGLVFGVGTMLFLFAGSTDRYFAWTVSPPITAALMGAAFLAAGVLELASARELAWPNARAGVIAVLVFTVLTLVVTLYHIDRFHTGEPQAWLWIAVYSVFPPAMLVILIRQLRVAGYGEDQTNPLPTLLRFVIALQAAVMIVLGTGLLVAPLTIAPHWPWVMSALTGRAIGAWLVGFGLAAGQAAIENHVDRVRNVALSSIIFALLTLIAVARYRDQITWGEGTAWILVIFLASVLLVGLVTIALSVQPSRNVQPA